MNKGIKKYKKVMSEYKSKYSSEVTHKSIGIYSTINLLKGFMNDERLGKEMSDHEHTLMHWIGHSLQMNSKTTKGDLDRIIEAKEKLSPSRIRQIVVVNA